MKYFIDWPAILILALVIGFFVLIVACVQSDQKDVAAFMAECGRDHKHYECEIMWRNSDHTPTVVAVPVVVGK